MAKKSTKKAAPKAPAKPLAKTPAKPAPKAPAPAPKSSGSILSKAGEAAKQLSGSFGKSPAKLPEVKSTTSLLSKAPQAAQQMLKEFAASSQDKFFDLPDEIKNSSEFKALDDQQKEFMYFTYKSLTATNDAEKLDAIDALNEAKKFADPYFKEQIRIAEDEIVRSIKSKELSMKLGVERSEQRIKELNEDLTFNRGQLNIEEQAELSRQLKENQINLLNLQQNAAESGLAFSSPRQEAESSLVDTQQGIRESTQRQFNRQRRELETSASRQIAGLGENISDIGRLGAEDLTSLQRSAEKFLGSKESPGVSGITPLGGITGSLNESKQSQILALQGVLQKGAAPFNF